jgi:KDO2-lipid IV(A) lauroyltransferase
MAFWLGLAVLRVLVALPYPALTLLGRGLGAIFYRLFGSRRRVALANIRACFPHLSERAQQQLCRDHFAALGMTVFEVAMTWWASDEKLARITTITGTEHLQQALAQGKGAILLAAHFTPLELSCRVLAKSFAIDCMYRPNNDPFIDQLLLRGRQRWAHRVIARDDVRTMLRSLQANGIVWYAPDQGFTGRNAVLASFFGIPAWTTSATGRIAQASGAAVLPFSFVRKPGAQGYEVRIDGPIADFPGDDQQLNAERIYRVFEHQVRRAPEQYLWIHRRFKSSPAPFDQLYP